MQNRSSHYDWFKGRKPDDQQNKWKDGLKTTWKFTRIFLFFSVFFFSMWGCVQTFTSKTNPLVGRGTELYSSPDAISPHVSSIHITKDSLDNIYIQKSQDNIWFNERQDEEYLEMQNQYKSKGVNSLDEALGGGNGLTRVINKLGATTKISYVQELGTSNIAVASTLFENPTLDEETKVQQFLFNNTLTYSDLETLASNLRLYGGEKDGTIWAENFSFNMPLISEFKTWNQIYNLSIFNQIASNDDVKNYLLTIPSKDASQNGDSFLNEINNHNLQVINLISFLMEPIGVPILNDWTAIDWNLRASFYDYADSGYTPIATWGQAFEMGRGSGPFYGLFVYPLAYVTNKLIDAMPFMQGWESFISIVLIVIVVSLIIFALSFKGTMQQTKMQELNSKKAIIEAKYSAYQGNKQMENRKRQEIAEMYKKEGINPAASLKIIFIQMPLFLAMWRVVGTIQHIKGTTWLGINFAATSYKELFGGQVQYLPLLIIAAGTNILAQYYPRLLTKRRDQNRINIHQKAAMKKSNRTQNIMMIVFTFMTLIFSAGLQVYFIIRSLWRVAETTLTHNILKMQKQKRIKRKIKV